MLAERKVLLEEQERYNQMHASLDSDDQSEDEAEFVFDGDAADGKESSEETFAKCKRPRENDVSAASVHRSQKRRQ